MAYFYQDFQVRYSDLDGNGRVKAAALLNFFEETAVMHCEALSCGPDRLLAHSLGWFQLRSLMKIERLPVFRQKLRVETWVSEKGSSQSGREYHMFDEQGRTLAWRRTHWVLVDLAGRHPVRIPDWINGRFSAGPPVAVQPFSSFVPSVYAASQKALRVPVLPSDKDTSGHVNNVRYAVWAADAAPAEDLQELQPWFVECAFKKELVGSASVEVTAQELGAWPYPSVESQLNAKAYGHAVFDDRQELAALLYTAWRPLDF